MELKLALLWLLFLSPYTQTSAQDRINRQKLSFEQSSEVLSKGTGWAYNATLGEWVDYQNVISENKDYKDKFKSLQGKYMMSKEDENFITIQTKTITFNNIKYYVLIIEQWAGGHKYPSLKLDYFTFKRTVGYIFNESEFSKLSYIENITELKSNHILGMGSKYDKYKETVFLDLIQTRLTEKKNYNSVEVTFPVMKANNGAIRFYLPDYYPESTHHDFEKKYFETSEDEFNKILIK